MLPTVRTAWPHLLLLAAPLGFLEVSVPGAPHTLNSGSSIDEGGTSRCFHIVTHTEKGSKQCFEAVGIAYGFQQPGSPSTRGLRSVLGTREACPWHPCVGGAAPDSNKLNKKAAYFPETGRWPGVGGRWSLCRSGSAQSPQRRLLSTWSRWLVSTCGLRRPNWRGGGGGGSPPSQRCPHCYT